MTNVFAALAVSVDGYIVRHARAAGRGYPVLFDELPASVSLTQLKVVAGTHLRYAVAT